MTNQQAIDLLSHTYFPCGSDSGEAIAKAVEALKAQEAVKPVIVMADLISRAAAIEYLMTNMGWHDDDGYEVDDADEKRAIITDLVNGIPVVDAAPVVHGRWEEHEDYDGDSYYTCSVCDCHWVMIDGSPAENGMSYCPNCGAKMDGERREGE